MSLLTSFLSLWQNTRGNQLKKRKCSLSLVLVFEAVLEKLSMVGGEDEKVAYRLLQASKENSRELGFQDLPQGHASVV